MTSRVAAGMWSEHEVLEVLTAGGSGRGGDRSRVPFRGSWSDLAAP